jgi:hypothetical protein
MTPLHSCIRPVAVAVELVVVSGMGMGHGRQGTEQETVVACVDVVHRRVPTLGTILHLEFLAFSAPIFEDIDIMQVNLHGMIQVSEAPVPRPSPRPCMRPARPYLFVLYVGWLWSNRARQPSPRNQPGPGHGRLHSTWWTKCGIGLTGGNPRCKLHSNCLSSGTCPSIRRTFLSTELHALGVYSTICPPPFGPRCWRPRPASRYCCIARHRREAPCYLPALAGRQSHWPVLSLAVCFLERTASLRSDV